MKDEQDYFGEPPIDYEGNKPVYLGSHMGRAAYLNSNWIIAIDAWDYCDPTILNKMLRRHPIPFELQPVIADIVSGVRKPNKKAAAKLKIPAGHRMIFVGLYLVLKDSVIDGALKREIKGEFGDYHLEAERRGIEVLELLRDYQEGAREFKKEWADTAGISVEALDNMVDSIKDKIKKYPHI